MMPTGRIRRLARTIGMIALAFGGWLAPVEPCPGDEPTGRPEAARPQLPRAGSPWPSAILLDAPADRDSLLRRLQRPDLVIWDAASFDRWLQAGRIGLPAPPENPGVVGSVAITARVEGAAHRVRVRLQFGITLDVEAATSVPIGLDGLILGGVTEGGRDLPVASQPLGRGWAVELIGKGDHQVVVETTVPCHPDGSGGATLGVTIPPSASTQVELLTSLPLVAASAGLEEPLAIDELRPEGARAAGHLGPRGRLELSWREAEPPGPPAPVLLAARGEIVVTPGLDALETRETWSITAVRGSTREVRFGVDPAEEVVDLQVDQRPVVVAASNGPRTELVVPLTDPISAVAVDTRGQPQSASILLVTRRHRVSAGSGAPERFTVAGHPIASARSQTGVLAVARADSLLIWPTEGRGVRRVDPGTELPESFRAHLEAWLGFAFAEQPFGLHLQVEAAVPRFEVTARSTVVLKDDRAEVATTLLGRVWQGRLFDLRVQVPAGLTFEPIDLGLGAPTVRLERRPTPSTNPSAAADPGSGEILIVSLPHPLGQGESFAVTLRGVEPIKADGLTALGLFQPLGSAPSATEVALVSGRNRRFELLDTDAPHFTRLDPTRAPAGWSWPAGLEPPSDPTSSPTWLRAEWAEASVPVRITSCPRSIRHRSSQVIAFDRLGAEVVAELTGEVANGSANTLDVALPPEVPDRWIAESSEGLERKSLDLDPSTNWRRYRLKLPGSVNAWQVRIRYRLEFGPGRPGEPRFQIPVQPIRVLEGTSTGQTMRLTSDPDVALVVAAPGWLERQSVPGGASDSVQEVRQTFEHPGDSAPAPIWVTATLGPLAELPTLVASRLWLRSEQMPGGSLASSARYRLEAHARAVVVRLPAGSRWVRAEVGGIALVATDIEQVDQDTYRITLPATIGLGPVPLRIDSVLDQPPVAGSWPAPDLLGGVVQQTAWELSLLGTRAGVGVPDGWTDENFWYREGLMWKRRPRRSETDLARWLADGGLGSVGNANSPRRVDLATADGSDWWGDLADGHHAYLFSRAGPPTALHFATWSRPTLVLVCSGPVLLLGLMILARRPPPRWVAGGLIVLGFLFVATVELNTSLLVVESASVGIGLAVIAALIQGVLDRRGRSSASTEPAVILTAGGWGDGSSAASPTPRSRATSESNEPTVIRGELDPDPPSTGEYRHPFTPIRPVGDPSSSAADKEAT